jgi:hypothetical protein
VRPSGLSAPGARLLKDGPMKERVARSRSAQHTTNEVPAGTDGHFRRRSNLTVEPGVYFTSTAALCSSCFPRSSGHSGMRTSSS